MIFAFKWYNLDVAEAILRPPMMTRHVLTGPVIHAECDGYNTCSEMLHDLNVIPAVECACGIYALKRDVMQSHEAMEYSRYVPGQQLSWKLVNVLAMIGLYGRVIEYEVGYRAQHAIIKRLCLLVNGRQYSQWFVSKLEGRYHAPVTQHPLNALPGDYYSINRAVRKALPVLLGDMAET